MRRYETLIVLHPELPEAQIRETLDRLRRLIESMGAECHEFQEWGMRDLAYALRKQWRGYYVLAQYSGKPEVTRELERTLKIGDEFLRFLSVVVPPARPTVERPSKARPPRPASAGEPSVVGPDSGGQ
jgi:small subunit ribosomal protein S6